MISGRLEHLVLLMLLASGAEAAPAAALERFLGSLAPAPTAPLPYVERRMSALLEVPLEVRGDLELAADGSIDKRVTAPAEERVRITATSLTLEKAGKQRVVNLSGDPRWRAFHAGLAGLMRRDAVALDRVFKVTLLELPEGWTLELRPRRSAGRNGVTLIRAIGTGSRLTRLRIEQSAAEWQELEFVAPGR